MTAVVNREEFLRQLDSVAPGLSKRELVEQSSCFVFSEGKVITFNDEVACIHACDLIEQGAVQAAPLLNILRKLPDEEITLESEESHLVVKGKRRKARIRMEGQVLLDLKGLEIPKKWKPIPDDFMEAIDLVQHTASKDTSSFHVTCIHIHPKWIESTDKYQATRCRVATGFEESTLIRKESVSEVTSLGMTKMCVTPNWIHFKNHEGLTFSCRRHDAEPYPNLKEAFVFSGDPIVLPKGLADIAERAFVFSAESAQSTDIIISISNGLMRVIGQGSAGDFVERRKIQYDGEPTKFMVSAKLLGEISSKYTNCLINPQRLMVQASNWKYATCLGSADAANPENE